MSIRVRSSIPMWPSRGRGSGMWARAPVDRPKEPAAGCVSQGACPQGYVEPHCHPWNIYNPVSLGEEFCRLGTTTLVCDNLIFYMMMGVEGFKAFMAAFSKMPVKFFWFMRLVPQTPMEQEDTLFQRPISKDFFGILHSLHRRDHQVAGTDQRKSKNRKNDSHGPQAGRRVRRTYRRSQI